MTGQEKGDLLIQVTAWAGLTVFQLIFFPLIQNCSIFFFCKVMIVGRTLLCKFDRNFRQD